MTREFDDIYRFPPVLGELDLYLLAEGNHLASYKKLGAHPILHEGVEGVAFAVWAPNASAISLVGDFSAWDGRRMPMRRRGATGFWELFVPGLRAGPSLQVRDPRARGATAATQGRPYAERAERPPKTASVVADAARACLAGRRVDGRALASQRPRSADRDLRGSSRLVAAPDSKTIVI